MGIGDEIIGSGLAKGAHARGKKIAFGDGHKINWGPFCAEVYENNPNVARPGEERLPNIEWVGFHRGSRGYSTLNQARNKWIWNYQHRMQPGEFFFSDKELRFAESFARGFIVIEPNLPWWKPVTINKDWGEEKYIELARRLIAQGHALLQFRHQHTRRIIDGAMIVQTQRYREAIAVMARASLYVGVEGGPMHAAAAVGLKGVVLFGGWSPPIVCGYPWHWNIVGTDEACGNITQCEHCRVALQSISVEQVEDAVDGALHDQAATEPAGT